MGITGQPQQDACACWQMERVLPVVECTLTYNPEEPGTAVIVDGIGLELVAGKRAIVVCIVNLEITCTLRTWPPKAINGYCGERVNTMPGCKEWQSRPMEASSALMVFGLTSLKIVPASLIRIWKVSTSSQESPC